MGEDRSIDRVQKAMFIAEDRSDTMQEPAYRLDWMRDQSTRLALTEFVMSVARGGYMPQADGALLSFAEHMHSVLVLDPVGFGTTTGDVTALNTRTEDFAAKLALVEPSIRNKTAVAAKNSSRILLRDQIRLIANQVYNHPGITDEQLTELGLTVRKNPTPIPAPTESPDIDIVSVSGNQVKIRVHNDGPLVRRKPEFVSLVTVWCAFGPEAPTTTEGWTFLGQSGRTKLTLDLPASDEARTIWLTAFWSNAKGQNGPACDPVSVNLPASSVLPSAMKMKKAA